MTATRQDAWSQDEDLLLAEVVLRYIREGGTQLSAFEEVGRQLTRTAAACGFRWNSYVRKQYKSGIELAKKQRKESRKQVPTMDDEFVKQDEPKDSSKAKPVEAESNTLTIQNVISFLEKYETSQRDLHNVMKENEQLKNQVLQMQVEVDTIKAEKVALENNLQIIEEDYKALIEIMERARKMVVLQEDERSKKVKFQMDRNGNLERIEK
ncbi:RsfA family transcriptional regulator [Litchfieldia salsa]|uniref:Transcription factor, RsfA family n=1 Tax=Litchfieldia salsa TaxID=930152 RepID=A0A1H0RGR4_9BACI|nr:RsfA family transcriptional regulator [Litchfieldia salsa]SDP28206.1 transcription factor, RsfA family [Litchfieldia salsa]